MVEGLGIKAFWGRRLMVEGLTFNSFWNFAIACCCVHKTRIGEEDTKVTYLVPSLLESWHFHPKIETFANFRENFLGFQS